MLEFCGCCCSVAQLCLTPRNAMDCSMPDFPVLHCLLEFAQTHVHWVGDAINHLILCCPLLLLPSIFPSIRVFSNESALWIRWPKYWSFRFNISPSNDIQDWSPLGWTGWISLQSKGLSRVFSNNTVQKHQFFGAQPSLWSNSHIHTWLPEKFWAIPKDWFLSSFSLSPSLPSLSLSLLSVRRKIWFHAVNSRDFQTSTVMKSSPTIKGNDSVFLVLFPTLMALWRFRNLDAV